MFIYFAAAKLRIFFSDSAIFQSKNTSNSEPTMSATFVLRMPDLLLDIAWMMIQNSFA